MTRFRSGQPDQVCGRLFPKFVPMGKFLESLLLRPPHFGSIIDVLRHVPDRPLDLQCARVLMIYFKKL